MEVMELAEAFVRLEEQVLNLKHENEELKEALKLAISLLEKEDDSILATKQGKYATGETYLDIVAKWEN